MVLKLDSRVPLAWRDPFSLQFGADPARVILPGVTAADEHMIAALTSGVSLSGLAMIARSRGGTERDAARLVERLQPVLLPDSPLTPAPTVSIAGTGPTADLIARTLDESGITVDRLVEGWADNAGHLGIAVGHYVLDPQSYGFWLRRDLPHLPVVFGDGQVSIGPLVEPGVTPCLYCLEHYRGDADPAWSAVASQLWGRRSAAETPLASREAAALATRIAVRRLTRGREVSGATAAAASFRLDVDSGDVVRREWMPHPACGCTGLAAEASEAPAESGWAAGSALPTRVVAFGERA